MRLLVSHLLAALALVALPARATTFEPLGFDQLTARAEQIFVGTVTAANSTRTSRGMIVTDFVFDDLETVKGDATAKTSIRMAGGTVGRQTLTIPGAPTFRVGERYLVFVEGNGKVLFPTLGGPQGIFRMKYDAEKSRTVVLDYGGQPVASLPNPTPLAARPKEASPRTDFAAQQEQFTQEAFVAEIRKRLAGVAR